MCSGLECCEWKPDIEATGNLESYVFFPLHIPHMRLRDDTRTTCARIHPLPSVRVALAVRVWYLILAYYLTTYSVAVLVRGRRSNFTCRLRVCSLLESRRRIKQIIRRMAFMEIPISRRDWGIRAPSKSLNRLLSSRASIGNMGLLYARADKVVSIVLVSETPPPLLKHGLSRSMVAHCPGSM